MMRLPSESGCEMSRPLEPGKTQTLKLVAAVVRKFVKNKPANNKSRTIGSHKWHGWFRMGMDVTLTQN